MEERGKARKRKMERAKKWKINIQRRGEEVKT
jgi:hypothetical protein